MHAARTESRRPAGFKNMGISFPVPPPVGKLIGCAGARNAITACAIQAIAPFVCGSPETAPIGTNAASAASLPAMTSSFSESPAKTDRRNGVSPPFGSNVPRSTSVSGENAGLLNDLASSRRFGALARLQPPARKAPDILERRTRPPHHEHGVAREEDDARALIPI